MSINKVQMMSLKINVLYLKKKILPNADIINILFIIIQGRNGMETHRNHIN